MSLRDLLRRVFGASAHTENVCLACGKAELETLGPDVYRCSTCGHEGGDGLPAWIAARERSEITAMSPEQRAALALEHLEAARNLLAGVHSEPELGIPRADFASTVLEQAVPEDEDRLLAAALRDLLESEQSLERAATALADRVLLAPARRTMHAEPARAWIIDSARAQRLELERLERLARA